MTESRMVLDSGIERKIYVRQMFNNIAHRYDLLNHLLSGGIDIIWRKKAISKLKVKPDDCVLDLACGTGDFAIETFHQKKCRIVGTDIAQQMLVHGRQKVLKKNLSESISFLNGDGEKLPFLNESFSGVTIAFGIRNMGEVQLALNEMQRILKSGGQAVILEFSLPVNRMIKTLYLFYFNHILPRVGRLISKDSQAYTYLPASVEKFPATWEFESWMKKAGFAKIQHWKLLNGIAVIYSGIK